MIIAYEKPLTGGVDTLMSVGAVGSVEYGQRVAYSTSTFDRALWAGLFGLLGWLYTGRLEAVVVAGAVGASFPITKTGVDVLR